MDSTLKKQTQRTCQNPVDRGRVHFLPGEDDDVEDVRYGAEDADDDAHVAVDFAVARVECCLERFSSIRVPYSCTYGKAPIEVTMEE